jgi:hypothetical protein
LLPADRFCPDEYAHDGTVLVEEVDVVDVVVVVTVVVVVVVCVTNREVLPEISDSPYP